MGGKRRVSFALPEEQEEKEEVKCERTIKLPNTVLDIEDAAERSDSDEEVASASASDAGSDAEEQDTEAKTPAGDAALSAISSFSEMVLDPRVERAVERLGWRRPTPVQSAAVPMALSGRDIMVCAPTGSGKTGAFGIPIAQHLCNSDSSSKVGVRAVILVPTRELIQQVATVMKSLCRYIDGVRISSIFGTKKFDLSAKKRRKEAPGSISMFDRTADILVGTPSSIAELCTDDDGKLLDNVGVVVIDEADLVLSYGYEKDARKALVKVPTSAQAMLLSATLDSEEVDGLGKIALRNPLVINVSSESNEDENSGPGISHYFAKLKSPKDRFLVAYAMLRLNVLAGKVLVFVNHVNAGFRLKLFLDQFKIKSVVLNSQLPLNSRIHCVEQFNAGIFQVLIACDEIETEEGASAAETKRGKSKPKSKGKRRRKESRDDEFGLSRGFDFRNVAAVLNFDFPTDIGSYTHRAGRTGRAGASGTVLTLAVSGKEEKEILRMGRELGTAIGPLAFRMEQIEAFRYRVEDCLRMVTDATVNSARLADIQREMVNSEKLREYFDENPQDFDALKHDLVLTRNIPSHLAHIPSYLLPPALRESVEQESDGSRLKIRKRRTKDKMRNKKKKKTKSKDPLSSLSARSGIGNSNSRSRKRGVKQM